MRLALLILCFFKCVKDANGFNDTVFKELDVEGMVEDAHDPFLISKKTSLKESCSQVSFPKGRTENKTLLKRCRDKKFEEILRLTENYNYHLPPPRLGAVRVNFSINLRNVLEVNEVSETVSLETTLRMFWRDERLSLKMESLPERFESLDKDFVTLHPSVAEMIWVPDIFIDQAVNVRRPRYLTPAASLRVYRDGTIR